MPVVTCYCQDFLKADMQHIHRQITSLGRWEPRILTQKRENAGIFPVRSEKKIIVLPPLRWKNLRKAWYRHVRREPMQVPRSRVVELMMAAGRQEAEVVHVFFGHIGVMLRPWIAASPRPVVVSFHGADAGVDSQDPAWQAALRQVFQSSALILARSTALLEDLAELGCPQEKLRLQRTGIPLEAWPYVERIAPADGGWHFLQACRLVPKKGLLTSLRVFAGVRQAFPAARLTIAGDGPMLGELQQAAAELGISDSVRFAGFLEQGELRALTESAHILLHPSETPPDGNREGVPNAMLESMASGLPVLATHHGGIPEAVTHGVSGWLTAERDHAALTQGALELCRSPELYARMSRAARAEVEEKYERSRQTAILESYYDEAAALRRITRRA